ncbi:hypothetical protein [Agaribacter flavus]|uniref:Lipoprotein n=1 Tax=Agaribacter flavus TaxID=1902781 RepID=A0ABV7FV47_9ALTE
MNKSELIAVIAIGCCNTNIENTSYEPIVEPMHAKHIVQTTQTEKKALMPTLLAPDGVSYVKNQARTETLALQSTTIFYFSDGQKARHAQQENRTSHTLNTSIE